MLISFILLGFSASIIIFHGTWIDAGISSMLGAIMGSLLALAMKFPVYARVFDVSACALVSFIGRALHQHACYNASVIPAIVILLPGYNMTISMELTERQVVSGAIRMANAIFYTFMLAYGLHLGSFLYSALDPVAPLGGTCPANTGVPSWTFIPLFPLMSVGIGLSFGAAWRQWLSQLVCAALGFCVTYFMQDFIDDDMVLNSMATLVIGLYASLTLRFFDEQPLSPLCVGITLLLPGSLGVRGAYAFLNQKDLDHASFALSMLNVALGLSVGLFASTMIVYPAGKPKSLTITL
ncbi:hypothetical protein BC940DRAFT_229763 [Gongronella butleri]|nr:hypothetical protein BC940DRAFT_229763 [Gongronella butleri]